MSIDKYAELENLDLTQYLGFSNIEFKLKKLPFDRQELSDIISNTFNEIACYKCFRNAAYSNLDDKISVCRRHFKDFEENNEGFIDLNDLLKEHLNNLSYIENMLWVIQERESYLQGNKEELRENSKEDEELFIEAKSTLLSKIE